MGAVEGCYVLDTVTVGLLVGTESCFGDSWGIVFRKSWRRDDLHQGGHVFRGETCADGSGGNKAGDPLGEVLAKYCEVYCLSDCNSRIR
jgi:hypothetical protein